MAVQRLEFVQEITATPEAAWAFFSNPANLARITPPELDFTVVSPLPEAVYPGLLITYRVRPLFEIAVTWVTEITQVQAPYYFCDDQRIGPYKLWHHEHFFEPLADGRTRVRDVIHYAVPFGFLGEFARPYVVSPKLAEIFEFRRQAVAKIFA